MLDIPQQNPLKYYFSGIELTVITLRNIKSAVITVRNIKSANQSYTEFLISIPSKRSLVVSFVFPSHLTDR